MKALLLCFFLCTCVYVCVYAVETWHVFVVCIDLPLVNKMKACNIEMQILFCVDMLYILSVHNISTGTSSIVNPW